MNYILITFSVTAVCMDLKRQKIDNLWIILGWITGLFCQISCGRSDGILNFWLGSILPVFLLYLLFLFRMLGAGDIKFLSVLGGFMGPVSVIGCIIFSVLFGAILSMAVLILCGNLRSRLRYFADYFTCFMKTKKAVPYMIRGQRMENIHFSVPILMAVLLYVGGIY